MPPVAAAVPKPPPFNKENLKYQIMKNNSVVGANLGFRKHWKNCTKAELKALEVGENATLRRARIFNGLDPAYQNGPCPRLGFVNNPQPKRLG